MDLKRKAYDKLLEWKQNPIHKPLIVRGLRQVGKSYIVEKFAKENYKNVITFDFRHKKELKNIFAGDLDVDTIIRKSKLYFVDMDFDKEDTILIFEEIGDCPLARTSLKSFSLDGRYDIIATGSLLGVINYRRRSKIEIPTGYEDYLEMTSLDFEEFLWANGIINNQIELLKQCTKENKPLDEFTAEVFKKLLKDYIVVGGLPEAVISFINGGKDYLAARNVIERLIVDYRSDFGRFINDDGIEEIDYKLQGQLNSIFDSIPMQLAREHDVNKFKFSEVKKNSRADNYKEPFRWLEKAGLVLRCFNVKSLESPLSLNADDTYFKAFIADTGILMAMYPIITMRNFLNNTLDSRKGAIFENFAAVIINKTGLPLFYFANAEKHLEIDFLIEGSDGLILYEEKSTNGKMAASKSVMEGKTAYKATCCYKIIENNFGEGTFYKSIPQYCASFLLNQIKEQIYDFSSINK